ncbi:LL-diaminopimelate aminotransferase [Candidatus Proelusimicrobium excrementi]|uniref:LL-diaminopimelate aminotransferase n=1 Tax=Candidatus Proelusimicrobium excrementi TaxID=3416222 RepID=UPI003CB4396E|nr:LL-diaminopimelate aminotransferase [Elusimicrobiaceae bacterium]
MIKINENYLNLEQNYLFPTIAKKVREYKADNPSADVISLGIGDVTRALPKACVNALHKASEEMGHESTFRGYGPEQGYSFLIDAIIENDYKAYGIDLQPEEVFVSDGAKCDVGNIQEVFSADAVAAVADPVYPVYLDTNIMAGRAVKKLPCLAENGFAPKIPDFKADLIYLCSPNNPTGAVMTKAQLKEWVDYAKKNGSVIIFDSAYKEYIQEADLPRSIYEVEGAKEVAIEIRSFSKTAGFTGLRCAYMVVPLALKGKGAGREVRINDLWRRRHTTKFNGVPYIVQRAAEAVFSPEGKAEVKELISYYMENARIIKEGLNAAGLTAYGGENAPYIWLKLPEGLKSFDFFDILLSRANVVGTPGSGFGDCGEGYFRLTSFGSRENTLKAVERIKKLKL